MPGDRYYQTPQWRALRRACLKRDGYRCTAPGCTSTERLIADHIVSRRKGGSDTLANLRTLCAHHDAQVKETTKGTRWNNGQPTGAGHDINGRPRDPTHPWARS